MSHATTVDVATVLMRELTVEESDLVTRLLRLAAATLRGRVSGLEDRMSVDVDFADKVNYVESVAIARIIRNPEGYSYEVIGPYAVQRPSGEIVGSFEFTAKDLAMLGVGTGAFTIRPYLAPATLTAPAGMPPWWYDFGGS